MLEFTCTKKTNKEAAHVSILTQIVQESIVKLLSLDISEGLGVFLEKGQKAAFELLCKLASCRMSEMDNCIFEHPEARKDWVVVQKDRERTICTEVGEIQYRRRYYLNRKTGQRASLLDAMTGVEKYSKIETYYALKIIENSTKMSYEKAGNISGAVPISKTTVMNKTREVEDFRLPAVEKNTSVEEIHIQADEDHVHMRDGKADIAKLAVIHTTKEKENKTRNRLVDKRICTSYKENNDEFWYQIQDAIHEKYGVRDNLKVYIHGDGANWIKAGLNIIPNTVPILDTFHLMKQLRRICHGKYNIVICDYIRKNDFKKLKILLDTLVANGDVDAKEAREVYSYVFNNREGAVNALTLDTGGSCAEGLVSHLVSERFSRIACGWGEKGLDTVLRLRTFFLNGGKLNPENMIHHDEVLAEFDSLKREYIASKTYEPEHSFNITALTPDVHKLTWLKKLARDFAI